MVKQTTKPMKDKDKIIEAVAEELLGVVPIHKGPFLSDAEARRIAHYDNKRRFDVAETITNRILAIQEEDGCCENPHNKMTRMGEDLFVCRTCGKRHDI